MKCKLLAGWVSRHFLGCFSYQPCGCCIYDLENRNIRQNISGNKQILADKRLISMLIDQSLVAKGCKLTNFKPLSFVKMVANDVHKTFWSLGVIYLAIRWLVSKEVNDGESTNFQFFTFTNTMIELFSNQILVTVSYIYLTTTVYSSLKSFVLTFKIIIF